MKSIRTVVVLILCTILLSACGNSSIEKDLSSYPATVKKLVLQEIDFQKNFTVMKDLLGKDPQAAHKVLQDTLIPLSESSVAFTESNFPYTAQIKEGHQLLLNAMIRRHDALVKLDNAIVKGESGIDGAKKTLMSAVDGFNTQFIAIQSLFENLKNGGFKP